jgi:DNA-binding NtrC family response regulator
MEGEMLRHGKGGAGEPELAALFEDLYRRSASSAPTKLKLRHWVELAEAWRIAAALHEHRGNRSAAARSLGIGRRTLYSKMERLGIRPSWGLPATPTAPPSPLPR